MIYENEIEVVEAVPAELVPASVSDPAAVVGSDSQVDPLGDPYSTGNHYLSGTASGLEYWDGVAAYVEGCDPALDSVSGSDLELGGYTFLALPEDEAVQVVIDPEQYQALTDDMAALSGSLDLVIFLLLFQFCHARIRNAVRSFTGRNVDR